MADPSLRASNSTSNTYFVGLWVICPELANSPKIRSGVTGGSSVLPPKMRGDKIEVLELISLPVRIPSIYLPMLESGWSQSRPMLRRASGSKKQVFTRFLISSIHRPHENRTNCLSPDAIAWVFRVRGHISHLVKPVLNKKLLGIGVRRQV